MSRLTALVIAFACFVAVAQASCIATLYPHDPIRSGLAFRNGAFGAVVQKWVTYNFDTEIRFGVDGDKVVMIAPQGGQKGFVADISDVASPYLYYTIRYENDQVVYSPYHVANSPFAGAVPLNVTFGAAHFKAEPRHTYLFKIADESGWVRIVRAMVLSVSSDALTLRWDVIYDTQTSNAIMPFICGVSSEVAEGTPQFACTNNGPSPACKPL